MARDFILVEDWLTTIRLPHNCELWVNVFVLWNPLGGMANHICSWPK
jgi:hypothetical protein